MPADGSTHGSTPTPPPLPERTDSLNNRSEEAELRKAPWFQAGIPRLVPATLLHVGIKYTRLSHIRARARARAFLGLHRNSTSPPANFKYSSSDPVRSPVSSGRFCDWESQIRSSPTFPPFLPRKKRHPRLSIINDTYRDSREITLEVLSQEPEGAFMVRESTSKPGCYALSLRVPREFQPSGIAHYLIMRTNKGYKIKVSFPFLSSAALRRISSIKVVASRVRESQGGSSRRRTGSIRVAVKGLQKREL